MKIRVNQVVYPEVRNIDFAPETDLFGISIPVNRVCCDVVVPSALVDEYPINVGDSMAFLDESDRIWADYKIASTEWIHPNIIRLKAETDLSSLDKPTMPAKMYAGGNSAGVPLISALNEIFEDLNISFDCELAVQGLPVKGFAPKQKKRERLLWLLFATGTYLSVGWDSRLSIKRISEENTNFVPIYETYYKPIISYKNPVTEISITTYSYTLKKPEYWEDYVIDDTFTTGGTTGAEGGTGSGYSDGPGDGGFSSDPADDALVGDDGFNDGSGGTGNNGNTGDSGFNDDGGNDGSNDVQEQGDVGDAVSHRDVYAQDKDWVNLINTQLPEGTPANKIEVTDITLITPTNVGEIAARLARRYFKQMEVELDIINNRKFLPGDRVTVYLNPKECIAGYITSCNFKFGVQAKSRIKLTMCEKVQMGGGVTYNYVCNNEVVYTEQDETLYPVGITYAVYTKVVTVEGDGHRRTFLPLVAQVFVEITSEDQEIEVPCELALDLYETVLSIYAVDNVDLWDIEEELIMGID